MKHVTLTEKQIEGIEDIIRGTIDSIESWDYASEEEFEQDVEYWNKILIELGCEAY